MMLRGLTLISLSAFLVLSAMAQTTDTSKSAPKPLGKLIDVGGWRLHLNCTGDNQGNAPTVVLESGGGGFSFDWTLVQQGVAQFTRVCSYDRAGHAWSDLGPRPRTMKQIAYELHTALLKADIEGPYVLVGQSIGGLLIRTFAMQYPQEVAGMVLVDSAHEDGLFSINGKLQRMRDLSQGRTIPPIQTTISAADKALTAEEKQQAEDFIKQIGPFKIGPPFDRFPPEIQQARLWALAQPEHYAADSDPYWGEEFAEIYAARQSQEYPLGDIPLIVLIAGKSDKAPPNVSEAEWERFNEEKRQQKADLGTLSRNSKVVIDPKSRHEIHLDHPELVVNAIREVVEAARHHIRLTTGKPAQ